MLQAIQAMISASEERTAGKIDEAVKASEERTAKKIDEAVKASEERTAKKIEESAENTLKSAVLMMEQHFGPKFNLLAENQQIMMEKLNGLDELEVLDTRVSALEAMVKKINRELKELKQAQ